MLMLNNPVSTFRCFFYGRDLHTQISKCGDSPTPLITYEILSKNMPDPISFNYAI